MNNLFTFTSPNDLILEIPELKYEEAWGKCQSYSNPSSRYQAYINELCLSAVLPWLQEDIAPQAKVWLNTTALPSFWELVNGTVICIDATRIVLVPHESIDASELRVPQEWVDIPSWAGDYYLGVEVAPEDRYVRIFGYCNHAELKNKGTYDVTNRTYALEASDVTNDISSLAVCYEMCQNQQIRSQIATLPSLAITIAQNLITRLGNPNIIAPRLEIPFQIWGGLIENGGWRKNLYQSRIGQPKAFDLVRWLENGISQAAQQLGWGSINMQLGAASRSTEFTTSQTLLSRQLTIAGQSYELRIIPQTEGEDKIWRFELQNAGVGGVIPGGFKLRLLTEDLQPFPDNEDIATTATELLAVEVALEAGEGIVWEIAPRPENYDPEILKF